MYRHNRNLKLLHRLMLGNTMGMFDTYLNLTKEEYDIYYADPLVPGHITKDVLDVQLKVGDPCCENYCIGDEVYKDISDGLYLGHDGFVAIYGGKFVGVYKELKNSNGDHILCEAKDINFGNTETWSLLYGKNLKAE